jgi:hypothetical protein
MEPLKKETIQPSFDWTKDQFDPHSGKYEIPKLKAELTLYVDLPENITISKVNVVNKNQNLSCLGSKKNG